MSEMRNADTCFGERLRHLIESRGLNPHSLAAALFDRGMIPMSSRNRRKGDYFGRADTIENSAKAIRNHIRPGVSVDSARPEWIRRYCEFFGCSADYLYGYISAPTRETAAVREVTGLSEAAIERLIAMRRGNYLTGYTNALSALIEEPCSEDFMRMLQYSFMYDGAGHVSVTNLLNICNIDPKKKDAIDEYLRATQVMIDLEPTPDAPDGERMQIMVAKDTLMKSQLSAFVTEHIRDYAERYNERYLSPAELRQRHSAYTRRLNAMGLSPEDTEKAQRRYMETFTGRKDEGMPEIKGA